MNRHDTTLRFMSPKDQDFFEKLGRRIAHLRKERGLTQVQLAEMLEVSQQHLLSFEKGRRRVPVSTLPTLSQLLGVSVEDLLGLEPEQAKRGPAPKIQQQLERIHQLPRTQQKFVTQMLETVLQQAGL